MVSLSWSWSVQRTAATVEAVVVGHVCIHIGDVASKCRARLLCSADKLRRLFGLGVGTWLELLLLASEAGVDIWPIKSIYPGYSTCAHACILVHQFEAC